MLDAAQDILAVFYLEKKLSILREDYMARTINGESLGPDFYKKGETKIETEIIQRFYNQESRHVLAPLKQPSISNAEDYEGRTQKVFENATIMSHRLLAAIPFVGEAEPNN